MGGWIREGTRVPANWRIEGRKYMPDKIIFNTVPQPVSDLLYTLPRVSFEQNCNDSHQGEETILLNRRDFDFICI